MWGWERSSCLPRIHEALGSISVPSVSVTASKGKVSWQSGAQEYLQLYSSVGLDPQQCQRSLLQERFL